MRKSLSVILALIILLSITVTVTAAAPWTLKVISPTPNMQVTGDSLPIILEVEGYTLDARYAGTPTLPDTGHYHIILDGHLIDMAENPTDEVSMIGVTPGPHMLTLVPARNDHSEVMEGAVNVSFTYAGPFLPQPGPFTYQDPPSIMIVSPAANSTVSGESFEMIADIKNFELSGESYGKANVDGVGHWHIFVDPDMSSPMAMMASMKTMADGPSQEVFPTGLTPGKHTFVALLVDNMHMPFMDKDMMIPMNTMAMVDVNVAEKPVTTPTATAPVPTTTKTPGFGEFIALTGLAVAAVLVLKRERS